MLDLVTTTFIISHFLRFTDFISYSYCFPCFHAPLENDPVSFVFILSFHFYIAFYLPFVLLNKLCHQNTNCVIKQTLRHNYISNLPFDSYIITQCSAFKYHIITTPWMQIPCRNQSCKHCPYEYAKEYEWQNPVSIIAAEVASNGIYNFIVPLRSYAIPKSSMSPIVLLLERE